MTINELENLRLETLKEIDKLKPFVILGTFIIPLLIFMLLHYSGYDIKGGAAFIAFILIFPMIFYVMDFFEFDKMPQIKSELFARFTPLIFLVVATNLAKNYPKFFYVVVIFFTIFSMNLTYKMCMKSIKKSKQKKYQKEFKIQSLKPYLTQFGYNYRINGLLEPIYLRNSKLFKKEIYLDNGYIGRLGNDKISGEIDKVKFTFADVVLYDNVLNYEIYGVFFYASFNKTINSNLFVISKCISNNNTKKFKKNHNGRHRI